MPDTDATIANVEALGIPAGIARALIDQMARYDMGPANVEEMAQMALDATEVNFANGSGFRDTMTRAINGAAAFRARMMEMTTEAEGGGHA
jgi:hypothetical protein